MHLLSTILPPQRSDFLHHLPQFLLVSSSLCGQWCPSHTFLMQWNKHPGEQWTKIKPRWTSIHPWSIFDRHGSNLSAKWKQKKKRIKKRTSIHNSHRFIDLISPKQRWWLWLIPWENFLLVLALGLLFFNQLSQCTFHVTLFIQNITRTPKYIWEVAKQQATQVVLCTHQRSPGSRQHWLSLPINSTPVWFSKWPVNPAESFRSYYNVSQMVKCTY